MRNIKLVPRSLSGKETVGATVHAQYKTPSRGAYLAKKP